MEDNEFKRLFEEKISKIEILLNEKEKASIHFKSIANLFNGLLNVDVKYKKRILILKYLLLEYLDNIILEPDLVESKMKENYRSYIYPIGRFLGRYHKFRLKTYYEVLVLYFIIALIIAFVFDNIFIVPMIFIPIVFLRYAYLKFKEKKGEIYGYRY